MTIHNLSDILNSLNIFNSNLVAVKLLKFSKILHKISNSKHYNTNKYMRGGGTKNIFYNNNEYIFYTNIDIKYNIITYKLYKKNTNTLNSSDECLLIIIDKKNMIAELHNITYDKNCFGGTDIHMKYKTGSELLKIALFLLENIKKEYNLRYIQLTDNSMKYCQNKRIILSKMMTLLTGTTWYGKYGFIPKNKDQIEYFKNNIILMNKSYMKNYPQIKTYILNKNKQYKLELNETKFLDGYDNFSDMKVMDFLKKFISHFDKSCMLFYYIYEDIFRDIGLYSFHGYVFIKYL